MDHTIWCMKNLSDQSEKTHTHTYTGGPSIASASTQKPLPIHHSPFTSTPICNRKRECNRSWQWTLQANTIWNGFWYLLRMMDGKLRTLIATGMLSWAKPEWIRIEFKFWKKLKWPMAGLNRLAGRLLNTYERMVWLRTGNDRHHLSQNVWFDIRPVPFPIGYPDPNNIIFEVAFWPAFYVVDSGDSASMCAERCVRFY